MSKSEREAPEAPRVIVADNERIALAGAIAVLKRRCRAPPQPVSSVRRTPWPTRKPTPIAIAFLDIKMRLRNGLGFCHDLPAVRPRASIVFTTACREYSFDAWETGAC